MAQQITVNEVDNTVLQGWFPLSVVPTWSSGASGSTSGGNYNVYTVSGDQTGTFLVGFRLWVGLDWGIITQCSFAGGTTTIVLYIGTGLITPASGKNMISPYRFPQGFSRNPDDFAVIKTNATNLNQLSPVQNTWYNIGSISISVPPGIWQPSYKTTALFTVTTASTANYGSIKTSLSTSATSESDYDWTTTFDGNNTVENGSTIYARSKTVTTTGTGLSAFYLIASTDANTVSGIYFNAATRGKTQIKFECALF